jgi:omega-amidase
MEKLNLTLLQIPLVWENKAENLKAIAAKLDMLTAVSDVIVLPELFSTGFSMNSKVLAEKMDGPSVAWMQEQAAKKNCVICGSLIIEAENKYYNRLIWMKPDGSSSYYNKRHLFRMANENKHYSEGTRKLIVEYKGWKICLQVCYDLRFPVWSRRTSAEDYDLLIYIANWPQRRNHAWKSLLVARAIENQSYTIGVNRIGKDGNGNDYSGDSVVLNFLGEKITHSNPSDESAETVTLNKADLLDFRKNFPAELDADSFVISVAN